MKTENCRRASCLAFFWKGTNADEYIEFTTTNPIRCDMTLYFLYGSHRLWVGSTEIAHNTWLVFSAPKCQPGIVPEEDFNKWLELDPQVGRP